MNQAKKWNYPMVTASVFSALGKQRIGCKFNEVLKKRNEIAYKKISVCLIFLFGLLLCQACSKDDPNLNIVRVQIETNSDESVRIYGIKDSGETGVVIKKNYDNTFELENEGFSIEARCKDDHTLITIKVWVNGTLKADVSGNKYLTTGYIYIL